MKPVVAKQMLYKLTVVLKRFNFSVINLGTSLAVYIKFKYFV